MKLRKKKNFIDKNLISQVEIKKRSLRRLKQKKNPTDAIATKAEQYVGEPVKFLGEGDYSEVYLFYKNNIPYLIKIPIVSSVKRIQDEFTSKQISHLKKLSDAKLIPEIYEINPKFLIMEYIPAKSLNLAKWQLSEHEIETIFKNLKKEILKWHAKGFAHGDIHLDNILIDKNLNVYLIDPSCGKFCSKESDLKALDFYKNELFNEDY